MTSHLLRLVFPQWQGSGKRKYVYYGAELIRGLLPAGTQYTEVPVSLDDDIRLEKGMWGYSQILSQLSSACDVIRKAGPEKIFLIGGDCGTEVAPVSYLNKLYNGDLAVLWLDAHGDLNSPATSVTGNFHGMPLRCLLGSFNSAGRAVGPIAGGLAYSVSMLLPYVVSAAISLFSALFVLAWRQKDSGEHKTAKATPAEQ